MRSRLKACRSSSLKQDSLSTIKFEFLSQLNFLEIHDSQFRNLKDNQCDITAKHTKIYHVTALSRHSGSMNRILLLSYVPCGFWSRLITRILADETVIDIVRSFYHLPSFILNDTPLISFLNSAQTKWNCWQTGFGLRYFDTFLLRVKEMSLMQTSAGLQQTELNTENRQQSHSKCHYPFDYQRIKFHLTQQKESSVTNVPSNKDSLESLQWSEVFISPQGSSLIEIFLPNQALQVDIYDVEDDEGFTNEQISKQKTDSYLLEPNIEMLTKLLVIIVEHIDTLLEDWYPSLGTRFIHTSDGRFLITRIIPCSICMDHFIDETTGKDSSKCKTGKDDILSPDTSEIDSNLVDFYKSEVKKASMASSEQLFCDSAISTMESDDSSSAKSTSSHESHTTKYPQTSSLSLYHTVYAFMVEECILAVSDEKRLKCPVHGRLRIEKIAPDIVFCDLKENFCINQEQLRFGKLLGRGSFGFVFRAYYTPKKRATHANSVPVQNNLSTSTNVANSSFYVSNEQRADYFEVALKLLQPISIQTWSTGIRKVDIDAYTAMKSKWERDPMQYACKAYCTARTELNILASLKHANIASIIGICPKPLALVLTLAPHGSLDTHIKLYRRSGIRISTLVLQKSFLQISKALEYLHQHHIIYRDLKSENVLVWSFPNPIQSQQTSTTSQFVYQNLNVELKLADYGISRSSLPTGTKGFGGTEGFMVI